MLVHYAWFVLIFISCITQAGGAKYATILLTGQARTFNRTICSFNENIIKPLKNTGYDVHIFAVAPADQTASQIEMLRLIPNVCPLWRFALFAHLENHESHEVTRRKRAENHEATNYDAQNCMGWRSTDARVTSHGSTTLIPRLLKFEDG